MEKSNPFDICFTVMKIRYADYDRTITAENFVQENDRVNVFINLESVLKNLSMIQDLEKKLVLERNFEVILTSNIINLAAHYKRFFMNNRMDTRVYLYHTDYQSNTFHQSNYNENYRSYYNCKYTQNPKFTYLTDALNEHILPMVRTCCEFIPRVYYLCAKNIEGSVIPYLISEDDKARKDNRKNFIISSDIYDTQYKFLPGFLSHYLKRGWGNSVMTCRTDDLLPLLANKPVSECNDILNLYKTHSYYTTMLASLGNRERSIDKLDGVGFATVTNSLLDALATNRIDRSTSSPSILSEIYPEEKREQFVNNYYCTSIPLIYEELTSAERLSITSQRSDRFDNQGLLDLNKTLFYDHPLILETLCM